MGGGGVNWYIDNSLVDKQGYLKLFAIQNRRGYGFSLFFFIPETRESIQVKSLFKVAKW